MEQNLKFMRKAIGLSVQNIAKGGGPFAAVIVKEGRVIATGVNCVTTTNDPTAHAEIVAIRKAARKLKTFDLSGCVIYTSCEPCPMCMAAVYWARMDHVFYGNTRSDACEIGFDDSHIYDELKLAPELRLMSSTRLLPEDALEAFRLWGNKADRVNY